MPETDLPTHSHRAVGAITPDAPDATGVQTPVLDPEEKFEMTRQPYADLTVDSEPDHERDRKNRDQFIPYDPALHAVVQAPNVTLDPASWDDLRSLPAPPSAALQRGSGLTVFVCIQHPELIVMDENAQFVAKFVNGYLATDDDKIIRLLTTRPSRYVKRLDLGHVTGA